MELNEERNNNNNNNNNNDNDNLKQNQDDDVVLTFVAGYNTDKKMRIKKERHEMKQRDLPVRGKPDSRPASESIVNRLYRPSGLERQQSIRDDINKYKSDSCTDDKISPRKEEDIARSRPDKTNGDQWNDTLSLLLSTNSESNAEAYGPYRGVPLDGLNAFSIEDDDFEEEEEEEEEF